MAVKFSRVVFKKVGGIIIPVREGVEQIATRNVRVLPQLSAPQKIQDFFDVRQRLPGTEFYLQRKGSVNTVGRVRGFGNSPNLKEDIGVKVKDPNKIVTNYAKYAFENLHAQGFWKRKAFGTTNLVNLKSSTVAKTSIEDLFPSMKAHRQAYENSAWAQQIAISRKAHKQLVGAIKKGGKLVEKNASEMRLVEGIDRKINARAKGIRFIRKNGRIIPIRSKK